MRGHEKELRLHSRSEILIHLFILHHNFFLRDVSLRREIPI